MTFYAIDGDAGFVQRLGKHKPVQKAGVELRHTWSCSRLRFIDGQQPADGVDQQLPLGRNQHPERRKFVFW